MEELKPMMLHMNGGVGGSSYAFNSAIQRKVIAMTKPITEKAIVEFYSSATATATSPATLVIADMGCSSGPNTLFTVAEIVKAATKLGVTTQEYLIYLNDLPSNDFNTIFASLGCYKERFKAGESPRCYFAGVPGSFYGRLFPPRSLHFVHSSYSLQWLSKVPEGVENNKGNIYISRKSPRSVLEAYYEQFREDFSMFLNCRAEEVVTGGRMVLTFLGRRSDDSSSKECCRIWDLLAMALKEMVDEGLIAEEKLDNFNIPQYNPCPSEVKLEVENQGDFSIHDLAISEVDWSWCYDCEPDPKGSLDEYGYSVARCMRAVAEPLLLNHFGREIVDDCFERYRKLITHQMHEEKTTFVNVVVSLVRNECHVPAPSIVDARRSNETYPEHVNEQRRLPRRDAQRLISVPSPRSSPPPPRDSSVAVRVLKE